ncbi:MAG: hypothetical protein WCF75_18060, partial [Pseudolabrys sp.]
MNSPLAPSVRDSRSRLDVQRCNLAVLKSEDKVERDWAAGKTPTNFRRDDHFSVALHDGERLDRVLVLVRDFTPPRDDEALKNTFPASDPVSV